MPAVSSRHRGHDEEEESYFISMSDMMVGLVFIFIILLVYFAVQFRQTTQELTGANQTRKEILEEIKNVLAKDHIIVEIDDKTGVLRLPAELLFDSGQAQLKPEGQSKVAVVASALARVLPCYTFGAQRSGSCERSPHRIDAIFVEGHTDSDYLVPRGGMRDNYDLSVIRATNVYRRLLDSEPVLGTLMNIPGAEGRPVRVLSVSGYGPDRPVRDGYSEEAKAYNRRIDLRFLMATPDTENLSSMLVTAP